MRDRVCLVTGANSGIGLATTIGLARLGAPVVMLCRDAARGAAARDRVKRDTGNDRIELLVADLASFASIRAAADALATRHDALHVLVHNAGVTTRRRQSSVDGYELTLAVNHLAPFLLTALVAPLLYAGAPARVIVVSSRVERVGRIDFDDLQSTRRYGGVRAYAQSKLANILYTYELAARLASSGVTANCLHPGYVDTQFMRETPAWLRSLWRPFLRTPERGARTSLYLAASPLVDGLTGRYFEHVDRERRSSRRSYDAAVRARLWEVSAQLTGAPPVP